MFEKFNEKYDVKALAAKAAEADIAGEAAGKAEEAAIAAVAAAKEAAIAASAAKKAAIKAARKAVIEKIYAAGDCRSSWSEHDDWEVREGVGPYFNYCGECGGGGCDRCVHLLFSKKEGLEIEL